MIEPKINPLTGHEDGLPDPRPRPTIYDEMLASHQVDPETHLFDIYYRLQFIMNDLKFLVEKEMKNRKTGKKRHPSGVDA